MSPVWGYGRMAVLLLPPLGLAPLELTHPDAGVIVFRGVAPVAGWWTTLHVLLLLLFALFALGVGLLVRPPGGLEGRIAGLAIGVFAVCNSAFIAMDGISTGIIVANAGGLPPDQQQPVVDAVQGLWHNHVVSALATAGALGWLVGIAAAAAALVGLRSARPPLLLLLASVALRVPSQLPGLDTTAAEIVMAASVVAALAAAAALYAGRRRLDQAGILLLLLLAALSPQHVGWLAAAGVLCFLAAAALQLFRERRASLAEQPAAQA